MFIELTIVNFAWYFDISFSTPGLLVIWVLGISIIILSALVYLPRNAILVLSCAVIVGHNLLDNVHFEGSIFWAILHEYATFNFANKITFYTSYPIIPWFAVMSLGYCFGSFYDRSFDVKRRRLIFNSIGISFIVLFFMVRGINNYGNLQPWVQFESFSQTVMSFMNPAKYPPH